MSGSKDLQQSNITYITVPAEPMFETSPTWAELTLLACPDNEGVRLALRSVGVVFHVVPVDGSNNVMADLEVVDDSDGDAVTNLVAAFDFEGLTARVYNEVWRGKHILDPGDTVNVEADITTPDTAGAGAAFIVGYEVLERMAE